MTRKRDLDLPLPGTDPIAPANPPATATAAAPTESEPDQAERELLRRALVKVSFAANGIHSKLDAALNNLRQTVRNGGDSASIQQKVDQITDVLRQIGDETASVLRSGVNAGELLQGLLAADVPARVAADLHKLAKAPPADGTALAAAIVQACLHWPDKPSLWQRWFGKSEPAADHGSGPLRSIGSEITDPLVRLIDSMQLPEPNRPGLQQLRQQFAAVHDPEKLVELVEELASVLLDASAVEQAQFEQFLTQLNTRLAKIQTFLQHVGERDTAASAASEQLDQTMRNQMQDLQACVSGATDLKTLQGDIVNKFDQMIDGFSKFRDAQRQRQQRSELELKALREQLRATEDESARLRENLSEQRTRASTDALTHIPNRHAYHDRINQEYSRWRRYRGKLAMVICDIDHFKQINDKYGHMAGDLVLKHVATMLRHGVRESDFVSRYGGEEFVILLPETNLVDATKAINKLRLRIANTNPNIGGQSVNVTVSFGVAEFESDDVPRDVFHRADTALYRSKSKGRNQVCCERKGVGAAEETAP